MSSAPAGLEVLPDAQFSSYRLSVGQIRGLHARILAKVADNGELTGEWKIVLGSAARVPGVFHGTQLYSDPSLSRYEFQYEPEAGGINFPVNRIVTDWSDVDIMAAQRLLAVTKAGSESHDEDGFLAALQNMEGHSHAGAAIRWAFNTHPDATFSLDLQGLPMSASTAHGRPHLKAETAPTNLLCSFPVIMDLCGKEIPVAGPLPVLFAEHPDDVIAALKASLQPLSDSLKQLTWLLLSHEYVDHSTAVGFIKRSREGRFTRPFHSELQTGLLSEAGASKRPYYMTTGPSEPATGKKKTISLNSNDNFRKFPLHLPSSFSEAVQTALRENFSTKSDSSLLEHAFKRISQSLTYHSWARYESAWHSFLKFCTSESLPVSWPIQLSVARNYVCWADFSAHLAPATIKAYLSCLSQLHFLTGFEKPEFLSDGWIKSVLKGAENAKFYEQTSFNKRKPVTFDILILIGHQIMSSTWSEFHKSLFWSLSLLLFWGSFRAGELLPMSELTFDPKTNLTWDDIIFRSDGSIIVRIKSPKTATFPGQFVDIFPCTQNSAYCPVSNLKKFRQFALKHNFLKNGTAVFRSSDGNVVFTSQFVQLVSDLLQPLHVLGPNDVITGHSFRFGIPSTLALINSPELDSDVQIWGRWTSEAFKSYMKLVTDQKKRIFEKISGYLFLQNK
jgi:hypothetical protein